MFDEVLKIIEDLQSDESLNSLPETDVNQSVVLRILDALNWNTFDRREVSYRYSIKKKSIELALLDGNTPEIFIEVKRANARPESYQEELLDYALRQGFKIAILTNGIAWWFYLPLYETSWEERKFATVQLNKQDKGEIAQKLVDFLSKGNVTSGQAVQNAEVLYKKHLIPATLPEAWNQLGNEPDDLLVELLAEKTKELCGHKPDKNEVEQFLSARFQDIKIMPPAAPKPKPSGRMKGMKPMAFTFNGRRYQVNAWSRMLVKLCEILHTTHSDRFEQQVLEMKGKRGRPYFLRNPDPDASGRYTMINETGIFVNTCKSADQMRRTAEDLIVHFGYNKNDLSFEIR